MKNTPRWNIVLAGVVSLALASVVAAQVGKRFPSEKKIVTDPVTGIALSFLTSTPAGDSKIYQTHPQWTADGKWLIFRSQRAPGQAFAVNEDNGAIVQVTENGYMGMLCVARLSMKLYIMRDAGRIAGRLVEPSATPATPPPPEAGVPPGAERAAPPAGGRGFNRPRGPFQIVEIDLAALLADSEKGTLKPGATAYERVCGTTPAGMNADGNMGLDANEDFA